MPSWSRWLTPAILAIGKLRQWTGVGWPGGEVGGLASSSPVRVIQKSLITNPNETNRQNHSNTGDTQTIKGKGLFGS